MSAIRYLKLATDQGYISVGDDVARIEPQNFHGQLWFAVYNTTNDLILRINAFHVLCVGYEQE